MTKTKAPRLTTTANRDGSMTLYVNGKKDMRGTPAEVKTRTKELTTAELLSAESHSLFCELASDAGDWHGQPLVQITKEQRGNLSDLKKKGLLTTSTSDGLQFAQFTDAGIALAASPGDGPARFYVERCENRLAGQPLPDADGCIVLTQK
jgi:hypothetical protein